MSLISVRRSTKTMAGAGHRKAGTGSTARSPPEQRFLTGHPPAENGDLTWTVHDLVLHQVLALSLSRPATGRAAAKMPLAHRSPVTHTDYHPSKHQRLANLPSGSKFMLTRMLQAKLHRVRVTRADLHYEGSCGIDTNLLETAGIREFQQIDIYNINNGERLTTYAIKSPRGSGEICLNGAAARRATVGDHVIIAAYCDYNESELSSYEPVVILVDDHNRPQAHRAHVFPAG
jgi:aspartate 1-decarboxylase